MSDIVKVDQVDHTKQSLNLRLWKAFDDQSESSLEKALTEGANPDFCGPGIKARLKKSLLHKAAESGQVNFLQVLLKHKANPDIRDLYQRTPLHYAAEKGNEQIVKALLASNADASATDEKGTLAIHIAASTSNEIVKLLLRNGGVQVNTMDKKGKTALHYATSKGMWDIVMTLLENKADPNLKDEGQTTPLLEAVKGGHDDILVALINKGGRINDEVLHFGCKSSLLHYAVNGNYIDIVKTLLSNGHPVEVYDANGWAAFDAAAVNASVDIVRVMLEYGADPNYIFGEEAKISLHHAIDSKYHPDRAETVLLLIEHGARINKTDSNGLTPLDFAVRKGYLDIMLILLQNKANITMSDRTTITELLETAQAVKGYVPPSVIMRKHMKQLEKEKNKIIERLKGEKSGRSGTIEQLKKENEIIEKLKKEKNEVIKQCHEKDSYIAQVNHKLRCIEKKENDLKLQLQEKEKELAQSHQETVCVLEQQIQSQATALQKKDSHLARLTRKLHSKEADVQQQQVYSENSDQQLVQYKGKLSIDDVPKLSAVLQPVDSNWYQLGQSLGVESLLIEMKQKGDSTDDEQMKHLLEIWLNMGEKRTIAQLEKALKEIGRSDVLSGLHDMKSPTPQADLVTDGQDLLSKSHPLVADKCVQFDYFISSIDCLSEVHIAGKKLFLVQGERACLMNWEKYGLKLGISEGTLPSTETAEVAVAALVGGQFLFPQNTKLASAVYAVSFSKPFLKPLRLEVQHCVDLTSPTQSKCLKFAIAPMNTPSLPYNFSVIEGGEFSVGSWYGSISRNKFCLVCIVSGEGPRSGGDEHEKENQSNGEGRHEAEDQSNDEIHQEGEDQLNGEGHHDKEEESNEGQPLEEKQYNEKNHVGEEVDKKFQNDSSDSVDERKVHVASATDTKVTTASSSNNDSTEEYSTETRVAFPSNEESCTNKQRSTSDQFTYTGLVYYEQKEAEDTVTFTAVKNLNALLEYIKHKDSHAEIGPYVTLFFQPSIDCISLNLNSPQKKPFTGWTIDPHTEPCTLYRADIDNFGTVNYPLPPTCLISVYGSPGPDTVPILNYAVPVEGVVRPVTLFIRRTLRITPATSSSPTSPSFTVSSTGGNTSTMNPADVFRDNLSKLSTALERSTNFDRVTDELLTKRLLTMKFVDDITSNTSYTAYQRGSKVARELDRHIQTSQRPGDDLIAIRDILVDQEDTQLKELGHSMKTY